MNYEKGDQWGQGQERVMEQWCLSEYKTCMHENVIIHCFIQPICTNKERHQPLLCCLKNFNSHNSQCPSILIKQILSFIYPKDIPMIEWVL